MNEQFRSNLQLITNAVIWFSNFFGIDTPEFTDALTRSILSVVHAFYKEKGTEFNIEKDAISLSAICAAYDKIMGLAQLAEIACGIKPEDLKR